MERINLTLADGAAAASSPIFIDERGSGNERYLRLMIVAAALLGAEGSAQLYGLDLPNHLAELAYDASGEEGQDQVLGFESFQGDEVSTAFQTSIAYAAFANNNWLVLERRAGGDYVFVAQGAGAGKFQVSDVGGLALVTMGTATVDGRELVVIKTDPTKCLLYDLADGVAEKQTRGASVVWALPVNLGSGFNGANFLLMPIN
jgi:hypothetical protein